MPATASAGTRIPFKAYVNFLSRPLGKRAILIGLSIHYALWWAALVVGFWADFGLKDLAATPIGPFYWGIVSVSDGSWRLGAAGILMSLALVGTILFSVRKRRCWIVLLTHLAVPLYWFVGLLQIAAAMASGFH